VLSYIDVFNGRVAASRTVELDAIDGKVDLAVDNYAAGLLRLGVAGSNGTATTAKLTAAQLRRLIAELQAKLGCLMASE